jgi:3-oxoacyl-[acyl-carrier protein] reductase
MEPIWNDGHRFSGRVAIVTGAGGALGGAVARALGREGAHVALSYRGSQESAEATVAEIEAHGGSAFAAHLEVTDEQSVATFVQGVVDRFGGVDVLVNTAGRIDAADAVRFSGTDPGSWQALFDVDVFGTFLVTRAVVPHMQRGGRGAIINFSGSYGTSGNQENLVNSVAVGYCAAKGAIRGFTASLARDLAPAIRVNAVSPGPIAANWEEDWEIPKEQLDEALRMTPLKRMGLPEEIAETVLFLASDGGGYITGQILQVDGGWVLAG